MGQRELWTARTWLVNTINVHVYVLCFIAGNTEDKKVPTLVQAFADNKMVGVDCGSGDAHTLFLEDNGQCIIMIETMV